MSSIETNISENSAKPEIKKVVVFGERTEVLDALSGRLMQCYNVQLNFAAQDEDLNTFMHKHKPDGIILSCMLDVQELAKLTVDLHEQTRVPVLYAPPRSAGMDISPLIETGVDEILLPSMTLEEHGSRLMMQLRRWEAQSELKDMLESLGAKYELGQKRNDELELLAKADPLTGLYNRRYMLRKLQEEASRNQRSQHTFSVLICDLDYFSILNEQVGREICDRILQEIGLTLTNSCRVYDVVARWGADQFLLLLPETDLTWALVVAERCRRNVARYTLKVENRSINVSITVGVTEFRQTDGVGGCMRRVEQALKEAKQRERSGIVFCSITAAGVNFQNYAPEAKQDRELE